MNKLRVVPMPESSIEQMSDYISSLINDIKDDIFFEGAFYVGATFPVDIAILGIVYNDYKFHFNEINIEERNRLLDTIGMDLRAETIGDWRFTSESRTKERYDHPIEYMLHYGTILYDKNGKLANIKEGICNDPTMVPVLANERGACEFQPAIQYKKQK